MKNYIILIILKYKNNQFGSVDGFKEVFTKNAITNFGSGWTWLVKKQDGTVDVVNTCNKL